MTVGDVRRPASGWGPKGHTTCCWLHGSMPGRQHCSDSAPSRPQLAPKLHMHAHHAAGPCCSCCCCTARTWLLLHRMYCLCVGCWEIAVLGVCWCAVGGGRGGGGGWKQVCCGPVLPMWSCRSVVCVCVPDVQSGKAVRCKEEEGEQFLQQGLSRTATDRMPHPKFPTTQRKLSACGSFDSSDARSKTSPDHPSSHPAAPPAQPAP